MSDQPLTLSVPEAGKQYFGVSRNASYKLAEQGVIPTIRVGKLLRVPIRAMERILDTAGTAARGERNPRDATKRAKAAQVTA